ncbi:MAG TPA: inorganic phosphate transporter [Spirochaetota bacterium]|nr:inorganic phosphate transporter [Spirochaetota bacterium]HOM38303.1 inorganic phosphate transporter [Spirochaetota bacterium]HPQ48479.1 inorganic phosphate transporter [Spirochaetota bacterium]
MDISIVIISLTVIFGLYMAYNIGANDVANAIGTSVGSNALSFKTAIIVAAIFEFSGSILVGSHVSSTIGSKIVYINLIPDYMILIKGMIAALIGASIWLHLATYLGLPVSTTHSIVGGVIGFGIAVLGFNGINWPVVLNIGTTWILSPVIGGFIAALIFIIIRNGILDTYNPLKKTIRISPFIIFFGSLVSFLVLFFKGLKNLHINLLFHESLIIGSILSFIIAFFSKIFITKYIIKKINSRDNIESSEGYGQQYIIVENVFKYFQPVTACLMAFSHGANDVANATGPVASIMNAFYNKAISMDIEIYNWILMIGAVGIILGLITYGYKVVKTLGDKITEITPTRGFSAELAASLTILMGSKLGLPISTTHTIVGAIIGIGFTRGIAALNINVLKSIFSSWFITLPFTAVISALSFLLLNTLF